jgi:hypothetical protein
MPILAERMTPGVNRSNVLATMRHASWPATVTCDALESAWIGSFMLPTTSQPRQ